jgi:hypothetical protein
MNTPFRPGGDARDASPCVGSRCQNVAKVRVGQLPAGTVVRFSDETYGVVLTQKGDGHARVPVDLWYAPPALVPAEEMVELVGDDGEGAGPGAVLEKRRSNDA